MVVANLIMNFRDLMKGNEESSKKIYIQHPRNKDKPPTSTPTIPITRTITKKKHELKNGNKT